MSHSDEVKKTGSKFKIIACSINNVITAVQHRSKPQYGVQFHPEVVHTKQGKTYIQNFLFRIANCKKDWTPSNIISDSIKSIKEEVGDKKVITGISGGVDSTIVGVLLKKAIGDQSKCVFINTGLLRKDEPKQIIDSMQSLGLDVHVQNSQRRFLGALKNVIDPEEKRKIIGREFIRCFERISGASGFLAQGTLYPDVVESGTDTAATIKSHHNVGGLPDDMRFKLIEPLKDLFKDEVRMIGKELGLPATILNRKPFPGPGLAVRILGEVTAKRIKIVQEADNIFLGILEKTKEWEEIWQAFAVLIPNKTVGVMGDTRTYENIIALRAVSSEDGMTADWYNIPHDILSKCSTEIINNVNGVNRVVYDITSKPPGTIEWE
jgi:GMP synthase (glutamine-hydrolysing)